MFQNCATKFSKLRNKVFKIVQQSFQNCAAKISKSCDKVFKLRNKVFTKVICKKLKHLPEYIERKISAMKIIFSQ